MRLSQTGSPRPELSADSAGLEDAAFQQDATHTVAFHGAKGGVGTTTLAAECVMALAETGKGVLAIDLDTSRGDLHFRLDVPVSANSHSVADLLQVADEIDEKIAGTALSKCPCGASMLPGTLNTADASAVAGEDIDGMLISLSKLFDFIVIDTGCRLDGIAASALAASDTTALVTTPEIACAADARRALDEIRCLSIEDSTRILLLINRSLKGVDVLGVDEIESFLEIRAALVLPEDSAWCRRAGDEGRSAARGRSPVCRGFAALPSTLFPLRGAAERRRLE